MFSILTRSHVCTLCRCACSYLHIPHFLPPAAYPDVAVAYQVVHPVDAVMHRGVVTVVHPCDLGERESGFLFKEIPVQVAGIRYFRIPFPAEYIVLGYFYEFCKIRYHCFIIFTVRWSILSLLHVCRNFRCFILIGWIFSSCALRFDSSSNV